VERRAAQGGDCGSRNEGGPSRAAGFATGYDPRIAKIQELVGEVCRRAEIAKTPRTALGEVDYINIMLQGLQWQLALALVPLVSSSLLHRQGAPSQIGKDTQVP